MNANELADLLEHGAYPTGTREQAATMLRQQQAEIGCYKLELTLHKAMIQDLENQLRKEQEK